MFSGGIKSVRWPEYGLVYFRKIERVYQNTLLNTVIPIGILKLIAKGVKVERFFSKLKSVIDWRVC